MLTDSFRQSSDVIYQEGSSSPVAQAGVAVLRNPLQVRSGFFSLPAVVIVPTLFRVFPPMHLPKLQVTDKIVTGNQEGENEAVEAVPVPAVDDVPSEEPLERLGKQFQEGKFPAVPERFLRIDRTIPVELADENLNILVGIMQDR